MSEKESYLRLKKKLEVVEFPVKFRSYSTGVLAFDYIMGGGLPEGRLVELYGDFSSGKSVFAYQVISRVQQEGGVAMLHDSEGALNEPWAEKLGVNLETLLYYEPMTIEEVFEKMEEGIQIVREDDYFKDKPFLIVWDSVAATLAKGESQSEFGKPEVALRARLISAGLRRLTGLVRNSRTMLLFINQLRDRPMVMFGETEETTGGRAIKFHASLRLKMKKKGGAGGKILRDGKLVGVKCSIECTKSKVCIPFRYVDFELYYDVGIPCTTGLLDLAVREGLVQHPPRSPWYAVGDKKFRSDEFTEELWFEALEIFGKEKQDGQEEVKESVSEEE